MRKGAFFFFYEDNDFFFSLISGKVEGERFIDF